MRKLSPKLLSMRCHLGAIGGPAFAARTCPTLLLGPTLVLGLALCGCAVAPAGPLVTLPNPVGMPAIDRDFFWDQLVDVVDNYFEIEREQRVRLEGDIVTAGRIDTFPQTGATFLEPTRGDAANAYERLEGTLQSIRRLALVQVTPAAEGYLVEVAVYKELEDVSRPDHATSGSAIFRHDTTQRNLVEPVGQQPTNAGWIPLGRDAALEQRMLSQLLARLGVPPGAVNFPRPY